MDNDCSFIHFTPLVFYSEHDHRISLNFYLWCNYDFESYVGTTNVIQRLKQQCCPPALTNPISLPKHAKKTYFWKRMRAVCNSANQLIIF